ncbi:MAG TPA: AAA family ATPase [Micromonosporaceae bacterium]
MTATTRLASLVDAVLARPPRLGRVRLVAVDGPTGAGKSTFAERLAAAFRAVDVRVAVVPTDDLLDGWEDIVTFWPRLERRVLTPLSRGEPARYRPYDWGLRRFGDSWQVIDPPDVLLLEGVTSARSEVRDRLSLAVFVDAPERLRLDRVLTRDGAEVRVDLLRWIAAERAHFVADGTRQAADVVVDAAPTEDDPR